MLLDLFVHYPGDSLSEWWGLKNGVCFYILFGSFNSSGLQCVPTNNYTRMSRCHNGVREVVKLVLLPVIKKKKKRKKGRTMKFYSQGLYHVLKYLQTQFIRWCLCDASFSLLSSCFFRVGFFSENIRCIQCKKWRRWAAVHVWQLREPYLFMKMWVSLRILT